MTDDPSFWEGLIPYLPTIGLIVCALIAGAYTVWNRRKGNVETKAPTVAEIWAREERMSQYARRLERFIDLLADAFRSYLTRVLAGGSVEPTAAEKRVLDATPPSLEDK